MKKVILVILSALITTAILAQHNNDSLLPKGQMAGVKSMKFKSAINHQEYIILVKLPESYNDTIKKTYPVMYVLDAQWTFPSLMDTRNALLYDNLIPELIFVGIAFTDNYFTNRNRDFTPTHTEFDSVSGGATKFLEVITKEIIPNIDSTYHTDKKNNGLVGGSSGGLFVLYTLFQQPSPFNRFIANTPSLWYGDQLVSKMEEKFSEKNNELDAKLFLSLGGYEEAIGPPMFKDFCVQLKARNYNGFEMESLVVDKTGHLSVSSYANTRGLQFIFSKPDIKIDSLTLDQYTGHYEQGINITRKGNSLYNQIGEKNIRMNAETNESFYILGANGILEFIKDGKGKVTGFNVKTADGNFSAKKLD